MMKTSLSIRVDLANGGRFGPGKAHLLRAIEANGSISKAAAALGMSYPRALKLIDEMNGDFAQPVLSSSHGGAAGGGSSLTGTGRELLAAYDALCQEMSETAQPLLNRFRNHEKTD